jgi:hypothetical protein
MRSKVLLKFWADYIQFKGNIEQLFISFRANKTGFIHILRLLDYE